MHPLLIAVAARGVVFGPRLWARAQLRPCPRISSSGTRWIATG